MRERFEWLIKRYRTQQGGSSWNGGYFKKRRTCDDENRWQNQSTAALNSGVLFSGSQSIWSNFLARKCSNRMSCEVTTVPVAIVNYGFLEDSRWRHIVSFPIFVEIFYFDYYIQKRMRFIASFDRCTYKKDAISHSGCEGFWELRAWSSLAWTVVWVGAMFTRSPGDASSLGPLFESA